MSKGLGNIQRKLVAALEQSTEALDPFALAARVYRLRPRKGGPTIVSDAHLVSVRRALRSLEKVGKIYRVGRLGRTQWASERLWLRTTIRRMQRTSLALASAGDEAALRTHAGQMLPLLERAHYLGVKVS